MCAPHVRTPCCTTCFVECSVSNGFCLHFAWGAWLFMDCLLCCAQSQSMRHHVPCECLHESPHEGTYESPSEALDCLLCCVQSTSMIHHVPCECLHEGPHESPHEGTYESTNELLCHLKYTSATLSGVWGHMRFS